MTSLLVALEDRLHELSDQNQALAAAFPGDSGERQPTHVVYGGAHLFKAELAQKLGRGALKTIEAYAPHPLSMARALRYGGDRRWDTLDEAAFDRLASQDDEILRREDRSLWVVKTAYERMVAKCKSEPVEDFRIDFEDGYGYRSDDEEDATCDSAAAEVARGLQEKSLPPFIGIRIKSLAGDTAARGLRTLERFVGALLNKSDGLLPSGFVVTLPKVNATLQVDILVDALEWLENKHNLEAGTLELELMAELPGTFLGPDGRVLLPELVKAAKGRCRGVHFGTYDYTAACDITAHHQTMAHDSCTIAKWFMQNSLAATGVFLSDGATNVMPVGPNKGKESPLTDAQKAENEAVIYDAWRLSARHIEQSLASGIYQGWDLHPAQLPIRYFTTYAFFLEGFEATAVRLRNFVEQAARATLVGDVFDDAATGQGLLNYFLRGLSCGAVGEEDIPRTGLTRDEIATRSFLKILEGRKRP